MLLPLLPLTYPRPDEPTAGGADPAVAAAAAAAAAAPAAPAEPGSAAAGAPAAPATPVAPAEPAPAPWAKDIEERFADPAVRASVDAYLREKQQPYITKLEQERQELQDKAWVFDGLNADPEGTLREIAAQVWDDATADRIGELIAKGASPDEAVQVAEAEHDAKKPEVSALELSKLPPEVREAVEFAQAEKARRAEEAAAATNAEAMAAAKTTYDTWRATALEAHPQIPEAAMHAFVYAAEGDVEQGLANALAVFPDAPAKQPPPTLGGRSTGGIQPSRPASSLGAVFGEVFDAAHQGHTTL